jgi:2-polyprenyl-3-methyl-5-hydroxy-6-metoxy-1,4-benzoquinol methylase
VSAASAHESCVVCSAVVQATPAVRLRAARLSSCTQCGTLHYWPRASLAQQTARHAASEYLAHHPYFQNRRSRVSRAYARCNDVFAEVGKVLDISSLAGQTILDVGSGTGEFLEAARDLFKINPLGLDVSPDAVAALRERRIDARVSTLEEAAPDVSDLPLIVAIDLIEHVLDPVGFLRQVATRLRPGGVGYFETPNPRATVYRLGGALSRLSAGRPAVLFERLFPPEHQYYFPGDALAATARRAGLDVVRLFTRRMPASDAALALPLKIAMGISQALDVATGERLLLCLLARKPGTFRT